MESLKALESVSGTKEPAKVHVLPLTKAKYTTKVLSKPYNRASSPQRSRAQDKELSTAKVKASNKEVALASVKEAMVKESHRVPASVQAVAPDWLSIKELASELTKAPVKAKVEDSVLVSLPVKVSVKALV